VIIFRIKKLFPVPAEPVKNMERPSIANVCTNFCSLVNANSGTSPSLLLLLLLDDDEDEDEEEEEEEEVGSSSSKTIVSTSAGTGGGK
jgi:hypothetical protein